MKWTICLFTREKHMEIFDCFENLFPFIAECNFWKTSFFPPWLLGVRLEVLGICKSVYEVMKWTTICAVQPILLVPCRTVCFNLSLLPFSLKYWIPNWQSNLHISDTINGVLLNSTFSPLIVCSLSILFPCYKYREKLIQHYYLLFYV